MLFEKVTIGTDEVTLCCCGSVIKCYKDIFNEDFLTAISKDATDMNRYVQMGFVMAKFAELNDRNAVSKLTSDDFYTWLDKYSTGDIINAVEKIATIFMKESKGTVASKKG